MDGSERDAVARAKAGDREAFRTLVDGHARRIFRLSYRLTGNEEDAEDVVQDTFLKAYRSLDRFDDDAPFGAWLSRIATNTALDLLRRRRTTWRPRTDEGDEDPLASVPSPAASPEVAALGAEVGRRLDDAMGRLSAHERAALVLRHFEGESLQRIASTLGISVGAAKHSVFRAVAKLRDQLAPFREPL